FKRGVLSGAGGSWIYNLVLKQTPNSAELARALLGYVDGDTVDIFDPVMTLAATLWEPIEPMSHAGGWSGSVLLFEGVLDTFYLPRMVNALAMAGRFDAAEPATLDENLGPDLAQVGGQIRAAPFSKNRDGETRGMVQHAA